MPQVKAYRRKDGTLVPAHFRKGNSLRRLGSISHLRRTTSRYGKVSIDSLSRANLRRYGKPDAFGHKPYLVPHVPGTDAKKAKMHAELARETLRTVNVLRKHNSMPESLAEARGRFKRQNAAKRAARKGLRKR